jgi:hypothetical protein
MTRFPIPWTTWTSLPSNPWPWPKVSLIVRLILFYRMCVWFLCNYFCSIAGAFDFCATDFVLPQVSLRIRSHDPYLISHLLRLIPLDQKSKFSVTCYAMTNNFKHIQLTISILFKNYFLIVFALKCFISTSIKISAMFNKNLKLRMKKWIWHCCKQIGTHCFSVLLCRKLLDKKKQEMRPRYIGLDYVMLWK